MADCDQVESTKDKVIAALARLHRFDPEDKEAVAMRDVTENEKFMKSFMLGFRVFLAIMGVLTLVVGGIGVSNIMNVVVEERTKEIGVKLALGARQRAIITQFLFETMLLTALGGAARFRHLGRNLRGLPGETRRVRRHSGHLGPGCGPHHRNSGSDRVSGRVLPGPASGLGAASGGVAL